MDQAGKWQGGKGVADTAQPCPECGGDLYFSRTSAMNRGPAPAPHCFSCGYSGLFERQGDPANWGANTS